jgi:endonuclease/exonuclease/phosphatase family metal-dependent hydrolase
LPPTEDQDVAISEGQPTRRRARRATRALAGLAGALLVAFLLYRTLFVYTVSLGACPPAPAWTGMNGSSVAAAAPRTPVELKVLSYNIGGHTALVRGRHVSAVARLIAQERPDVVGLQEVHRRTWQARFRDQAAELAHATGMAVEYGPSFRALGGEFGNAVLVRGRVVAGEVLALPSFGEPRSLLRATVEVDGFELDVFVTHLTAWGGLNRRARTEQARCLAEQVSGGSRPFVLLGDLNAEPAAAELAALVGSPRLRFCGSPADATHALLGRRLDYVFGDPRFELLEASVLRTGPSDHWPVIATLRWPGPE